MRLSGPDRYGLTITPTSFVVECAQGTPRFSGIATSDKPKIYVVSVDGQPIYVGITKQSLRSRLRLGWTADGTHGYHGYAWRHHHTAALMDVWCHEDASNREIVDIETIEAEVVFLIRCAGQWPLHQTEIHFHPSTQEHRDIAAVIMARYDARPASRP